MNLMLQAALQYAARNWAVFPCRLNDRVKSPPPTPPRFLFPGCRQESCRRRAHHSDLGSRTWPPPEDLYGQNPQRWQALLLPDDGESPNCDEARSWCGCARRRRLRRRAAKSRLYARGGRATRPAATVVGSDEKREA